MLHQLRNFLLVLIFASPVLVFGAPSVTNVRAAQRPDTHLVDIYYNLTTPDAPALVSLEISGDSGLNYNITATTVTGDIGKNISTGNDRHIVWNAGKDRPGILSTTMRFKVIADDGIPSDQQLDADTLEFITRATSNGDAVAPTARKSLDNFVRESKRLGFWSSMVFVPCRQGYGSMNTIGGSPKRINTKFIRQGTTTVTGDGVEFIPGPNFENRVQTPFAWNPADEPVFVGVLGHTNTGNHINPGQSFLRWNTGTTSNLLGTYNCGGGNFTVMMGFSTPNSFNAEYLLCNPQLTSVKRPNFAGAQFDGSHDLKGTINQLSATLSHPTASTGRPTSGPVYFFQPADANQTHVIQGCVLFYGESTNLPMKEFWPMIASTYLSDRTNNYTYLCLGGQSNANGQILEQLSIGEWQSISAPLFHYSSYSYGGQYISYWLSGDVENPQRTSAYDTAKNTWMNSKPAVDDQFWTPLYFWIQGESDTETDQSSLDYSRQLRNLASFLREDLRTDLVIAVAQIDYSINWRTTPNVGNVSVSGCSGTATGANGNYSITSLSGTSNSYTPYTWNLGSFRITKDGGETTDRWRIHSEGTTYYVAEQNEPHPVLVTTWIAANGATETPTFGSSRTGNIERVRKAQRDFTMNDAKSFTVDTRGCERSMDIGGVDFVHMTTNGYTTLANRLATNYSNWIHSTP